MNQSFGKAQILSLLKQLDRLLKEPVTLIICGGAAGIVQYGLNRGTIDIDIVQGEPPVSQFINAVRTVAEKNGIREQWINDGAKGYARYLPVDFKTRLTVLEGPFHRIQAFVLAKVDLYVMKLAAFRAEDIEDLEVLGFPEKGKKLVVRTMEQISRFDPKTSLKMEMYLQEKGYV